MPREFFEELTIEDKSLSRDDVMFHGPFLKVKRAETHKNDLLKRLEQFRDENVSASSAPQRENHLGLRKAQFGRLTKMFQWCLATSFII